MIIVTAKIFENKIRKSESLFEHVERSSLLNNEDDLLLFILYTIFKSERGI